MAGILDRIDNDGDKVSGVTHGCGCCSSHYRLTPELLRKHILRMERDLEKAKNLLENMESGAVEPDYFYDDPEGHFDHYEG